MRLHWLGLLLPLHFRFIYNLVPLYIGIYQFTVQQTLINRDWSGVFVGEMLAWCYIRCTLATPLRNVSFLNVRERNTHIRKWLIKCAHDVWYWVSIVWQRARRGCAKNLWRVIFPQFRFLFSLLMYEGYFCFPSCRGGEVYFSLENYAILHRYFLQLCGISFESFKHIVELLVCGGERTRGTGCMISLL